MPMREEQAELSQEKLRLEPSPLLALELVHDQTLTPTLAPALALALALALKALTLTLRLVFVARRQYRRHPHRPERAQPPLQKWSTVFEQPQRLSETFPPLLLVSLLDA
eukprot:gene694-491_t